MNNPIVIDDLKAIHAALPVEKFRDSEVLVTGCAGFLGYYFMQYLVRYADELGIAKVIGLDNFMLDRPDWLNELQTEFPDKLDLHAFDIAKDKIATVKGAANAAFVIHMASIASPMFYRQYPVETLDANIWGLRQLMDFYRGSDKLRGFLFFSSSEIYGDPVASAIPTNEEYRGNVSAVGPRACYDEAKRFGETLCYVFSKTYNMPITVARPFNNYGPGMRIGDKRLPADFAKCVVDGRDMEILSDGSPTRTFCYISDAITGYLKCLLHGEFDYFNIGIDKPEISVRTFAGIFQAAAQEIYGRTPNISFGQSDDAEYLTDNPNRRCPDIAKARSVLAYDPQVLVEEGVSRYLQFLKHEGA